MKIVSFTALFSLLLLSCKNDKAGNAAKIEITPGISNLYEIDPRASLCEWKLDSQRIKTVFTVPLSSGRFSVLDGIPTAADFVLDFHALSVNNNNLEQASKRSQILKDSFFLNCAMYPVGRCIMTKLEQAPDSGYKIGFDLKIKDLVRPVQLVADLQITENEVRLTGKPIALKLMEWGINNPSIATMQPLIVFKRIYPQ